MEGKMSGKAETGLETLLDLNGMSYRLDNGYWVKFEAYLIAPSEHVPHGVKYTLTLHDRFNTRVIGFDNAHDCQPPRRKRFAGRRIVWDHRHPSAEKAVPYEYESAARLIEDFWSEVERILRGETP
jgi:hypothetical protein